MTISKKTGLEIAFLVMSAFIIMTAVSASSPIYPLNVWDDVNVYFTVGRGVFEGQVPYMDLYEQKGPIFLLMYAVASLISKTSFTGVWLFECIAASVFAIFSWKTVKLFVPKAPAVCIGLVPVLMGITYTIGMFNFGGNTEEFCFPLLSVVLYVALKMIKEEKVLPGVKDSLVCGLIAGMLFWTKYTLLGFILGFILILIVRAVRNKAYKLLLKDILYFIAGFAVVSLPVFIYFGANHALGYLWEVYFYNNIFNYIGGGSYPGLLGNQALDQRLIHVVGVGMNVAEHGPRPPQQEGVHRGGEGKGGNDDLVLRLQIRQQGRHFQRRRPGGGQQHVVEIEPLLQLLVYLCRIFSVPGEPAGLQRVGHAGRLQLRHRRLVERNHDSCSSFFPGPPSGFRPP